MWSLPAGWLGAASTTTSPTTRRTPWQALGSPPVIPTEVFSSLPSGKEPHHCDEWDFRLTKKMNKWDQLIFILIVNYLFCK